MGLNDYLASKMESVNKAAKELGIEYKSVENPSEICALYNKYTGNKNVMRALCEKGTEEYLKKGFEFVGAYDKDKLVGIACSKYFPENYNFFKVPSNEQQGKVFSLGNLFVDPNYQGKGIAKNLTEIITLGTEDYSRANKDGVGMGYEVYHNNIASIKTLSKYSNFVGFYSDEDKEEGLSIMLYRPFTSEANAVKDCPKIELSKYEYKSARSLTNCLTKLASQENIGGFTTVYNEKDNGKMLLKCVLNSTPITHSETFEMEK